MGATRQLSRAPQRLAGTYRTTLRPDFQSRRLNVPRATRLLPGPREFSIMLQLYAHFDGLLRMPYHLLAKHRNTRRRGAKPYYGRVSNGLLHLPHDLSLDGRGI